MTTKRYENEASELSASDFRGSWRVFDDREGRCPAEILRGRVEILSPVVNPDVKAILRFEDLEGFPINIDTDADFVGDGLGFEVEGTPLKIVRCDRDGRRVIHCAGGIDEPGSWTAEEEDGGGEGDPPTSNHGKY